MGVFLTPYLQFQIHNKLILFFKSILLFAPYLEGTVLFNFAALVFLLAARQFANHVCIALAGSVGCEQKEPKKLQSASLRDALAVSTRLVGLCFLGGAL
ncbi:hypothetical protein [uncultured Rikenella sp.]|uniref:hypothetical protein n=1 Tax=uncultured Rikenella sp. TaxID=368003 RepID=UPI00260284BD|nr:hypothetical protein [uncultured Rikenella sp.]